MHFVCNVIRILEMLKNTHHCRFVSYQFPLGLDFYTDSDMSGEDMSIFLEVLFAFTTYICNIFANTARTSNLSQNLASLPYISVCIFFLDVCIYLRVYIYVRMRVYTLKLWECKSLSPYHTSTTIEVWFNININRLGSSTALIFPNTVCCFCSRCQWSVELQFRAHWNSAQSCRSCHMVRGGRLFHGEFLKCLPWFYEGFFHGVFL